MKYAEVVISIPTLTPAREKLTAAIPADHKSIWEKTFHYSIPPHLAADIALGQLVVVPFGPVERQGIVLALSNTAPVHETRDILEISDPLPVLSLPHIELARWLSRQYCTPLPRCIQMMLPPGLIRQLQTHLLRGERTPIGERDADEQALLDRLQREGELSVAEIRRRLGADRAQAVIRQWVRAGYAVKRQRLAGSKVRPKIKQMIALTADPATIEREKPYLGHPNKQAEILQILLESNDPLLSPEAVLAQVGCGKHPLQALAKRRLIELAPEQEFVRSVPPAESELELPARVKEALKKCPSGIEIDELCRQTGCTRRELRTFAKRGWIEVIRREAAVVLLADRETAWNEIVRLRGAKKQMAVLDFLAHEREPVWLGWIYAQTGATLETIRDLEKHGLIEWSEEEVLRNPLAGRQFAPFIAPKLTADQEAAWQKIKHALSTNGGCGKVFLLHGVTGSGKTEIYLRALEIVLQQGRGAIVLIPEIALTPQTIQRFAGRFPNQVAIQHSDLTMGERYDLWRQVRARQFPVVVGTRSALFAPIPNLGLIILDEEHDASYKQGHAPRYHAREAAVHLAKLTGALVILGSATPDVTTYAKARAGRYELVELPGRICWKEGLVKPRSNTESVAGPKSVGWRPSALPQRNIECVSRTDLPPVTVVDMREELRRGNRGIFSTPLVETVRKALAHQEQVILFLNRRGMSTFVMCRDCGLVLHCPQCDVSLTFHAGSNELRCHHCNRHFPIRERCPQCSSSRIKFFGLGTEKVAALATEMFPGARILRWDRDAVAELGGHEIILEQFLRGDADILIGTQMVAKGLDLPRVTVVGVISADTTLHLPDFRAAERTFQLLTQVAGRAGRSALGGEVIVQTYTPEHYAIQAASRHDYSEFYQQEMKFRRQHRYPPFSRLVRLLYVDPDETRCRMAAEALYHSLTTEIARLGLPEVDLIGPAPCFFRRLNGRSRWHLILRARDPFELLNEVWLPFGWQVDVDPLDLL